MRRTVRWEIITVLLILIVAQSLLYYREQQASAGIVSDVTQKDTGVTVYQYYKEYERNMGAEEDVEKTARRSQLSELYSAYHLTLLNWDSDEWDPNEYYTGLREEYSEERVAEFDRLLAEDVYFAEAAEYVLPPELFLHTWREEQRIEKYASSLQAILSNAERMQLIGLFSDKGSFSYHNIIRTAEDYRVLESVRPVIEANYGTHSVLNYKYTIYFCVAAMLLLANCLAEERQRGLVSILHLAPRGRGRLAAKQAGTLFVWSVIVNVTFYAALVVQGVLTYGHGEAWFTQIQNLEQLSFFPALLDKWQLLLIIVLFQTLATYMIAMLFLTVSAAFRNNTFAWIALGAIFLVEYIPYSLLKRTSAWAILAHANVFTLLKPREIVTEYFNWGVKSVVIPRQMLYLGAALVPLLFLLPVYCLVLPRRKPVESEGFALRAVRRVEYVWNRFVESLSGFGKEAYKLLIVQKGLLVLALAFVLMWNNRFHGTLMEHETYQAKFYELFEGKNADEAFDAYLVEMQQTEERMTEQIKKLQEDFDAGRITALEYSYAYGLGTELQRLSSFVMELENRQKNYHSLRENGIMPKIIDERGYTQMFGEVFYDVENTYALIAMTAILLLAIPLFSQEKQAGMTPILRATMGRDRVYRRKLVLLLVCTGLVWLGITVCDVSNVIQQFALSNWDAPVQSIGLFAEFQVEISIKTFMVFFYLRKLILLIAFALGVSVVGERLSFRISLLVGTVLLTPHLVYLCGVAAAAMGSVVIPVGGTQLYGSVGLKWWWIDVAYVAVALLVWLLGHFLVVGQRHGR